LNAKRVIEVDLENIPAITFSGLLLNHFLAAIPRCVKPALEKA
jgi:hypothetical protein